MTERLGMVGTTRTYVVESTRFIYEGRFLAVANQQARTECSETTLPLEDFDMLWKTLYRNDAFTLADNEEGHAIVGDAPPYHIEVEDDGETNEFSVNAPRTLARRGEERYHAIVEAIRNLADLRLPDPSTVACSNKPGADRIPVPQPQTGGIALFPLDKAAPVEGARIVFGGGESPTANLVVAA